MRQPLFQSVHRFLPWGGYAVVWALLLALIALPVALVLGAGAQPLYLLEALRHPAYQAGLLNAFTVACIVTVLAFGIALPLAWLGWRYRFRYQGLAEALVLAPLILPPFVGALGVFQLFGTHGVLNSLGANLGWWTAGLGPDWLGNYRLALICIVEALGLYPILYLLLAAGFARLDGSLIEAAAACGASRWTAYRRVALPLLRPALFAGGSVVFVWSFTELGTPLMLGFDQITPVQIFHGLASLQSNQLPFALVLIMLVVVAACFVGARLLTGRFAQALVVKGAQGEHARRLRGWGAVWAWLPFAAVTLAAATPHLVVVLLGVAKDWYGTVFPQGLTLARYHEALSHEMVVPAITNSLLYSLLATVLAVALGFAVAWITTCWRPFGSRALDGLAMVPLAVPGLIMAFGFLALAELICRVIPAVRPWIHPEQFPVPLLVIAYAIRRLPHVVRATNAGLLQAPPALEEAAAACGAGFAYRLRRVTLPIIAGSVAAGAILTFSFSMLEVSYSLILAQQRAHWPITKVIYDLVALLGTGPAIACAFATWAMAFLAGALACAAAFLGRSPTSLFRG